MGMYRTWVAAALASAAAAAAWSSPAGADVSRKTVFNLGPDTVGQACRAQRIFGDPLVRDRRDRAYDVFCGAEAQAPIGRIFAFSRADALTGWRNAALQICADAKPQAWSSAGLSETEARLCAGETSGELSGAPGRTASVQLAGAASGRFAAGDVTPAAAPALERGLRILLDAEPEPSADAPVGPRSALQEVLQAALGREIAPGGFADFVSLRRLAYENNALWLFAAAETQFAAAIQMHATLWPNDLAGCADLQAERALNLSNQRRFAAANRALTDARDTATRSKDGLMAAKVDAYAATIALNAGDSAGAAATARIARAAIAAWRKTRPLRSNVVTAASEGLAPEEARAALLEAQTWRTEGVALRQSRPAEALAAFDAGRAAISDLDPGLSAGARIGFAVEQASVLRAGDKHAEAVRVLNDALAISRTAASRTRVEANLLMDLGAAQEAAGAPGALDSYREAFAMFAEQPENRGVSADRAQPYLRLLIAQLNQAPDDAATTKELFAAFETIASPAVAQTAAAAAARAQAGDQEGLIRALQDAERRLRRAIAVAAALPATAPEAERRAVNTALEAQTGARDKLARAVSARFPNYGVIALEPSGLEEVQTALQPNERLIRFALGQRGGYALVVDKDRLQAYPIPIGEAEASALVSRIKAPLEETLGSRFDAAAAATLFEHLFGQIRADLFAAEGPSRLLIDAPGALASLPFGVLLTDAGKPGQAQPWLARRFSIMSAPGVRAIVTTRAAEPKVGSRPLAAFGDFTTGENTVAARAALARRIIAARQLSPACESVLTFALEQLGPLPETRQELRNAAAVLGADESVLVMQERFTVDGVRAADGLSDARIVLFATHGVFASDFEKASPIASACLPDAALMTSAGTNDPGVMLDLETILDLDLSGAEMVILSACDTGNPADIDPSKTGLLSGGDALSGLGRAFLYAGARSVVVTHWQIPDEVTARLMQTFLRAHKDGKAAPEAMQAAQLAILDEAETANPFFWGAFAVVGAPMSGKKAGS
jgi:CHAT domain-containing protein